MKIPARRIALALLLAAGLAQGAAGAPYPDDAAAQPAGMVRPEDRNAALKYWAASFNMRTDVRESVDKVDWTKVGVTADNEPEEFQAASKLTRQWMPAAELLAATRMARCDFEIEYEKGFETLLQHLGMLRVNARMLRVDARALLIEGNAAGAAERIGAMARIAHHVAPDRIMISSLVAISIAQAAVDEATTLLDHGARTAASDGELASAFGSLAGADPFQLRESILQEIDVLLLPAPMLQAPNAGEVFAAVTGTVGAAPGESAGQPASPQLKADQERASRLAAAVKAVSAMNAAELHAALERTRPAYRELYDAWVAPDAPARLLAIGERMDKGEFGPVAGIIRPSLKVAYERNAKAIAAVKAVLERLKTTAK